MSKQANNDSNAVKVAIIGAIATIAVAIIGGIFALLQRPSPTPTLQPPSTLPPTNTDLTTAPASCQVHISAAGEGPELGNRGFISAADSKIFLGFITGSSSRYPWNQEKLNDVVSTATAKGNPIDKGEIETHVQGEDWYFYGLADKAVVILYAYNQTAARRSWVAILRRDNGMFEYRSSGSDAVRQLNNCSTEDITLMGNPHVQVSIFNPSDDLPNRIYYKYFVASTP